MVVSIDHGRCLTGPFLKAPILRPQFGFDFGGTSQAHQEATKLIAERPKAAIGSHQARHSFRWQDWTILGQTRMPAEFQIHARGTPGVNGGLRVHPSIIASDARPTEADRVISPGTSRELREMMRQVVVRGTARSADVEGYEVGGKTGTAQIGTDPPRSHTWIIGFAGPPGQPASVAVAVVVLNQSGNNEATGGVVAAPIAKEVMEKVLQVQYGG